MSRFWGAKQLGVARANLCLFDCVVAPFYPCMRHFNSLELTIAFSGWQSNSEFDLVTFVRLIYGNDEMAPLTRTQRRSPEQLPFDEIAVPLLHA